MNGTIRFSVQSETSGPTFIQYQIGNGKVISFPYEAGQDQPLPDLAPIIEAQIRFESATPDTPLRLFVTKSSLQDEDPLVWEALRSSDGRPFSCRQDVTLVHSVQSVDAANHASPAKLTRAPEILVVGCTPASLPSLNIEAEFNRIRAALRERDREGTLIAYYRKIVTDADLINALNEVKPDILHFIGHTIESKGQRLLALSTRRGRHIGLGLDVMKTLFLNSGMRFAILNACHSQTLAHYLAVHGLATVGMRDIILDKSARAFAEGFYFALARGETFGTAVNEGRSRIYYSKDKKGEEWSYPVLVVADENVAGFRVEKEPVPMSEVLIECPFPEHATIFINEEMRGLTPMTIKVRLGYSFVLRLEREGYHKVEKSITPTDRHERVSMTLAPRLGNLSVQVTPHVSGATVSCQRVDNPAEVHTETTDVLGVARFSDIPVGRYQLKASLGLATIPQIEINESTSGTKPLELPFPVEMHLSDAITQQGINLWRVLQKPSTIMIGVLLLVVLTGGVVMANNSFRLTEAPPDMERIDGQAAYPLLGIKLDENNTLSQGDETVEEWKRRIEYGNLVINELRNAVHLQQVGRAWGEPPSIYPLRKTLYVDATEVTVADYEKFLNEMSENPDQLQKHAQDDINIQIPEDLEPETWSGQTDCGQCPVVGVDFFDAWSYTAFVGKRLPTHEEWEMAARGKEGRMFPWGDDYQAWRYNGYASHETSVVPVMQYKESNTPEGIYDLAGNADEWVILQQTSKTLKVGILGGSFASRGPIPILPYGYFETSADSTNNTIGFRAVADENVDGKMIAIEEGEYPIGGLENPVFDMIRDLDEVTTGNQKQALLGESSRPEKIEPFYIDKYEITIDEYAKFMDRMAENPQLHVELWSDYGPGIAVRYEPLNWAEQLRGARDLPVTGVNWFIATAYCRSEGKRLPTLYEFEYLMGRGEEERLFPTGDAWKQDGLISFEKNNLERVNVREVGPRELVSAKENSYEQMFGLYHIYGNADEWVDDPRYLSGRYAYIKGGNYEHHGYLKTFRFFKESREKDSAGGSLIGFRCAKDAD